MTSVPRYVVVPTHNRPRELHRVVSSLVGSVDAFVVIDNASDPAVRVSDLLSPDELPGWVCLIHVIRDEEQPPNLYRLWNVGFDAIEQHARSRGHSEWDVIVLNDDVIIPPNWCNVVSHSLRELDVVAASTSTVHPANRTFVSHEPGEGGLAWRLCAWAFIMRGEAGVRADERLRWWYGDNDIDWTMRELGGIAVVPGPVVVNELANSTTNGELAVQTGRDRQAFIEKWGRAPW